MKKRVIVLCLSIARCVCVCVFKKKRGEKFRFAECTLEAATSLFDSHRSEMLFLFLHGSLKIHAERQRSVYGLCFVLSLD